MQRWPFFSLFVHDSQFLSSVTKVVGQNKHNQTLTLVHILLLCIVQAMSNCQTAEDPITLVDGAIDLGDDEDNGSYCSAAFFIPHGCILTIGAIF